MTGQCRCRPGIEGRKCDRVIPGYYYALSDNLKYEAEDARGIGVSIKGLFSVENIKQFVAKFKFRQ